MSLLRVHCMSLSVDGYGAGPRQSLEAPLGIGGEAMHEWIFPTRTFAQLYGDGEGETGLDDAYVARSFENIGAWIMGRNMFTPERGAWLDRDWKGWWGEAPPYHSDVFVLTHHPRARLEMEGGTVFHFVTDGIEAALERAKASAGGKDVRLGGGVSAIRQYFEAQLIDQAHFAVSKALLGGGEAMFAGLDLPALGYGVERMEASKLATHVTIGRHADAP